MHDIKYIRENGEVFDAAMQRRGLDPQSKIILEIDASVRAVQTELQDMQAARNAESKRIGELKKAGEDAQAVMDSVASMKEKMSELEEIQRVKVNSLNTHLAGLPNIMADDVPDGADEDDNVEMHVWGERREDKTPEHYEIGEALGLMDFETAAKMSGSRFVLLSGGFARMERALSQFFLDTHTGEHGYTEVSPPLLVRDNALFGTGQLPKFEEDLFKTNKESFDASSIEEKVSQVKHDSFSGDLISLAFQYFSKEQIKEFQTLSEKDLSPEEKHKFFEEQVGKLGAEGQASFKNSLDSYVSSTINNVLSNLKSSLYAIPTSEVPLTNIVADSIVEENSLPRRYTAFTPNFRSEAGSAGRDTRGMLRQHQFYKVEQVCITKPEDSDAEQKRILQCAETVMQKLELPYRVVTLCSGDTGFGAIRTFDIEVWLPGQQEYREIASISNCGDFQARRMNARFKREGEKQTTFVHTLNGSGVAVGRALIAVIENYYDAADGSVRVPEVLKPYMGGIEKIVS